MWMLLSIKYIELKIYIYYKTHIWVGEQEFPGGGNNLIAFTRDILAGEQESHGGNNLTLHRYTGNMSG